MTKNTRENEENSLLYVWRAPPRKSSPAAPSTISSERSLRPSTRLKVGQLLFIIKVKKSQMLPHLMSQLLGSNGCVNDTQQQSVSRLQYQSFANHWQIKIIINMNIIVSTQNHENIQLFIAQKLSIDFNHTQLITTRVTQSHNLTLPDT